MIKTLLLFIVIFLVSINSVLAQTGLFGNSGTPFIIFGVVTLIVFVIIKSIIDAMKK